MPDRIYFYEWSSRARHKLKELVQQMTPNKKEGNAITFSSTTDDVPSAFAAESSWAEHTQLSPQSYLSAQENLTGSLTNTPIVKLKSSHDYFLAKPGSSKDLPLIDSLTTQVVDRAEEFIETFDELLLNTSTHVLKLRFSRAAAGFCAIAKFMEGFKPERPENKTCESMRAASLVLKRLGAERSNFVQSQVGIITETMASLIQWPYDHQEELICLLRASSELMKLLHLGIKR